jgi:predicted enzyme related to lactoylglutathione lyase
MKRVTGIGGIFFKSKNPEKIKEWYRKHLGIEPEAEGNVSFKWRDNDDPKRTGSTVWASFPHDTDYFNPSSAPFMINYRVENLDYLLEQLRKEGVKVEDRIEEYEYGRFGWLMDPEGNRIELWQPPA